MKVYVATSDKYIHLIEIYQFLLDEMDVIHFIEELSEEEQEIVINKINLES